MKRRSGYARGWGLSIDVCRVLYLDNLTASGKFVVESYAFSSATNITDKSG